MIAELILTVAMACGAASAEHDAMQAEFDRLTQQYWHAATKAERDELDSKLDAIRASLTELNRAELHERTEKMR